MKKYIKYGFILLAMALLFVFVRHVDFAAILAQVSAIGWKFSYIILITGAAYWVASLAWKLSFADTSLSVAKLFVIRQIGESLTLINPANFIVGESSKAILLQKEGINYKSGISSLLISRSLIVISSLLLLLFASLFFVGSLQILGPPWFQITLIITALALVTAFIYVFFHKNLLLFRAIRKIQSKYIKKGAILKILPKLEEVNIKLSQFYKSHKKKLIFAFVLSTGHWILGAFEFYIILNLLEYDISILNALMLEMGVMLFKSMGAFVPGQIGVEEMGNKFMLEFIGVPNAELWVAVSILRRARQIVWLFVGLLLFGFYYKKI